MKLTAEWKKREKCIQRNAENDWKKIKTSWPSKDVKEDMLTIKLKAEQATKGYRGWQWHSLVPLTKKN